MNVFAMSRMNFYVFVGVIACSGFSVSGRDGASFLDDSIVINDGVKRVQRNINTTVRNPIDSSFSDHYSDEEAFGLDCETAVGTKGTCKKFRECFPLIKVSDVPGQDGWVLGHYDVCSYISADNTEIFGVCCTSPVETPPQQEPDIQRISRFPQAEPLELPPQEGYRRFQPHRRQVNSALYRQVPAQWPPTIPPLPTHPPNHAAPTHPPSLIAGYPTLAPVQWPGINPVTQATTKQTWPTMTSMRPTNPAPTAAMPVATGSCGMKNERKLYREADTSRFQDQERIVGGHDAGLNEWPWIVALFNNGRQFCGGSLIDDRHVLSAAHCVAHMTSWDVARLTARLGDHDIRIPTETMHVERKIKRVVRHRGFDMRTLYHDISLLTLDQPVTFSRTISPICLPTPIAGRSFDGVMGTVIGWGSLIESGRQPDTLQEVKIPIWSNNDCRLKYGSAAPGGIVDHMLCAGSTRMDSCSGDSGGPLMVNEGGRWVQVGVVSWGIGCGKGQYPGVYSRVTSFMPWIQKNAV